MAVEPGAESLLIQDMTYQADAAAQSKEAVQISQAHHLIDLLFAEGAAGTHQVYEQNTDAPVDIQYQVTFLGGGELFYLQGIVQKLGRGEVGPGIADEQLDSLVRVLYALDLVAYARDVNTLLFHLAHKLLRGEAGLLCPLELPGGIVDCPPKPGADG